MIPRRVLQGLRATGFAGLTAAMLPLYLSHRRRSAPAAREAVTQLWVRRWARALLGLFSIEVIARGPILPPTRPGERGRLVVANHRSAIDIGVLLATFGGTMVSRADIAGWPVVGAAARSVGTIFVDRSSARSGAEAIRTIEAHLRAGATILLFPEGTTFEGDEVRPFHGGAFVAAARAGADVVPVGLAYPAASGAGYVHESFVAHLARMARSDHTRMALVAGPPIAGRAKRGGELAALAREAVQARVREARSIAGP